MSQIASSALAEMASQEAEESAAAGPQMPPPRAPIAPAAMQWQRVSDSIQS